MELMDEISTVVRRCTECHKAYTGPVYYSLVTQGETLCPDCAGPYLDPDIPSDPRRPAAD